MKKPLKIILACICVAAIAVCAVIAIVNLNKNKGAEAVSDTNFEENIDSLDMMQNTWQTAVPQTEIYDMISNHFASPLPEGKTEKKAIVIGYDGCRVDNFTLLKNAEKSGINALLDNGGKAVFSYAGGVNYPAEPTQKTSTAPGWCSMLTGKWADVHKITENGHPKEIEPKTLLLSLVEDGTVDKSAFYVSWKGHFTKKKSTYINEKQYIEDNKINSVFLRAKNDDGTKKNVLSDINSKDCSDFIFLTLEYTDHSGHGSGFSLENPKYVQGFRDADETGAEFIDAIKARENYDKEDWLIVITTDHGGYLKEHGGPTIQERITFIVSNK